MRISVECGGFVRAADACLTANHTAAVLTESLASRLARQAGMAGNDSTSTTFARAYDAGSAEAVEALADLTHAFIGAGRLLAATGAHHASAEAVSAGVRTSTYAGGDLDDDWVRVQPRPLPSSLGAQEPSLGRVDSWILDQVEGFVWPGADVDELRAVAAEWRRGAATTAGLADHVDAAVALVEQQRSPEVPMAVDALTDLAALVGDTAWQLSVLATACDEQAAAVEETRARTKVLLAEIAQMIVEGAALSAIVGGLTGGLGGGAAAGAAAARVRAQAPRFYALLTALRAAGAATAARLDRVLDDVALIRNRVQRFVRAPARGERGSVRLSGGARGREPGWLRQHEVPPGHTIERHVGKTTDELLERLADNSRLRKASSFDDVEDAERLIARAMERRTDDIREWLADGQHDRLRLTEDMGQRTGTTVYSDGSTRSSSRVRVVLMADPGVPTGWRILTAFPD